MSPGSTPSSLAIHAFLKKARRYGYDAEKPAIKRISRPGTDLLNFPLQGNPRKSRWYWEDEWVGGNPYSGATTVWYRGRPCWQNHYWGYVIPTEDKDYIYSFLRWARRRTWPGKQRMVRGVNPRYTGLVYHTKDRVNTKPFEYKRSYENIKRGKKILCEVYEIKGLVR